MESLKEIFEQMDIINLVRNLTNEDIHVTDSCRAYKSSYSINLETHLSNWFRRLKANRTCSSVLPELICKMSKICRKFLIDVPSCRMWVRQQGSFYFPYWTLMNKLMMTTKRHNLVFFPCMKKKNEQKWEWWSLS